jgi:hypothetical protein
MVKAIGFGVIGHDQGVLAETYRGYARYHGPTDDHRFVDQVGPAAGLSPARGDVKTWSIGRLTAIVTHGKCYVCTGYAITSYAPTFCFRR